LKNLLGFVGIRAIRGRFVSLFVMQRPAGVTAIAILFFLASAYLCGVGAVMLAWPGTLSMRMGAPLLQGLELAGPYMFLLVGAVGAVIGWGLFRLHRWARWAAMIVMAVGIGGLVPAVSTAELGWPVISYGLQIALRAATAWYLAQSPAVLESFMKK
jgi:hypothetical protein